MTRDEIKLYLDTARAEAKASGAELRADLKAGKAAMSVDVANLKTDIRATFAVHAKWNAAIGSGS